MADISTTCQRTPKKGDNPKTLARRLVDEVSTIKSFVDLLKLYPLYYGGLGTGEAQYTYYPKNRKSSAAIQLA